MKLMQNQEFIMTIIMEKNVTNPFMQTVIQKRYLGRTKFTSHNLIDSNVIDYMIVSESVYNMLSVRVQDFLQSRLIIVSYPVYLVFTIKKKIKKSRFPS